MGIFHEEVEVFNRAPVPLTARFDGQEKVLQPGLNHLPAVAVPNAKNQNPIMGSADPSNPHVTGARYLIGVVGTKDTCTPLTDEEWQAHLGRPCRWDEQQMFQEEYGSDPKARLVTHGKGRKTVAQSRYEKDVAVGGAGSASFEARD